MALLSGRNKMLPRQDSLPPPNTTTCSGWDCLQQSQQFGVIFSIILSVLTLAFLYWFLFWRRRNPLTKKQQDDDPEIVEIELRSPNSSQTTAVIRFVPGDPGDRRRDSQSGTVFRLYKDITQPGADSLRNPARNDERYILGGSSVSDSSPSQPPGVKGRKKVESSNKQGRGISAPGKQNPEYNQAIEQANASNGRCGFCGQCHTISHQQRLLYMNQLGLNWYNQHPRINPALHTMPTVMPGVQLGQVPRVHCCPYFQPYMAPTYTPMPASTPAAPMVPSQPLHATHFSQTSHKAQAVPAVQPFQPPVGATTTAQANPATADVPKTTVNRIHHPPPAAQPLVYRDTPWWRRWVWRHPTTGRASTIDSDSHRSRSQSPRSSFSPSPDRSQSPEQDRPTRRNFHDGGKDVRPTSRKRGRSPVRQRQEGHSTQVSQKQSDKQPQPEPFPDLNLSDLGSLPSHTTLDSNSAYDCHVDGFTQDKVLAAFERARLAEPKSSRTEVLGPVGVTHNSSKSVFKETPKDSTEEGSQRELSGKQTVDKILITISPPTSSTRSAKTAAGASDPGDSSGLKSTVKISARLHPDSASKREFPGGKRGDRKKILGDGVGEVTKEQFLSPKETSLSRQVFSARRDDHPVLYRVDDDGYETASLGTSTEVRASSSGTAKSAACDDNASLDSRRRRLANRDREIRNQEVINSERYENCPEDFHEGSDLDSFRPRPPRPFTTEAMSLDEDQSSLGDARDELAFKNRNVSRLRRGEVDSMGVQISPPEVVGFGEYEIPQSPSLGPVRKKRGGDSSEFFRFRGSDDNVENKSYE
ncbi:hypothetical protein MCOR25_001416 [Pyricularia grisea]|nr:hypothetical protein MCOR25_001416 [Pyricularia grisea]